MLMPQIAELKNLQLAWIKARRGKRCKIEVINFGKNLTAEIQSIREDLLAGCIRVGDYHYFTIKDPKERKICAASFRERVLHHALMNYCESIFERNAVFHSYACRKGKGRLRAIAAAENAARGNAWYLKLDMQKYFESIPHDKLMERVCRLFKDREVLKWFERIICSHQSHADCGLPIGSLCSQYLANFYLGSLDRYCQSFSGVRAYVRYMDDFVCWSNDKEMLKTLGRSINNFVEKNLQLKLKYDPSPQRTHLGMNFLGYRIYSTHTTLNRRSKVRYRRKVMQLEKLYKSGGLSDNDLQNKLTSLTAFTLPARSWQFHYRALSSFVSATIGYEPGESGRQLDQQRAELPFRQSQQEYSGQSEQQFGVPSCS